MVGTAFSPPLQRTDPYKDLGDAEVKQPYAKEEYLRCSGLIRSVRVCGQMDYWNTEDLLLKELDLKVFDKLCGHLLH
jgi:hypothetical protein